MHKQAITSQMETTVLLKKHRKDMLWDSFYFDEIDLMNYKHKQRCMNAEVMMSDKATQTLNKENTATQQTYHVIKRHKLRILMIRQKDWVGLQRSLRAN